MKNKTVLKQAMKSDLMRVYREVCASHECSGQQEAYRLTVTHQAPRFYVDARWAHQVISPMMRGDRSRLDRMTPLMREMYEELFRIVLRLGQEERYWGKSLNYIIQFAVLEPAPRFYIDIKRMGQVWTEYVRKRKSVRNEQAVS